MSLKGKTAVVTGSNSGIGLGVAKALAKAGATQLDAATFDLLRVEAGRPAFPADMNQGTIPLEAGIEDRAISTGNDVVHVFLVVGDRGD